MFFNSSVTLQDKKRLFVSNKNGQHSQYRRIKSILEKLIYVFKFILIDKSELQRNLTIELYNNLDYALWCLLSLLDSNTSILLGRLMSNSVSGILNGIHSKHLLLKNIHDKIIFNALTLSRTQEQFPRLSKFNQSCHHAPLQLGLGDQSRSSSLTSCKVTVQSVKSFY